MARKTAQNKENLTKRETVFAVIIMLLLLLLFWWWFAMQNNWWPMANAFPQDLTSAEVMKIQGTPLITRKVSDKTASGQTKETSLDTGNATGSGSTNSSDATGSGNDENDATGSGQPEEGNTGGSTGATSPSTPADSAFLKFAANLRAGQAKVALDGAARGLNRNCIVVVNSNILGKQEVCLYRQGTRIVTVTLLNEKVISIARTGF